MCRCGSSILDTGQKLEPKSDHVRNANQNDQHKDRQLHPKLLHSHLLHESVRFLNVGPGSLVFVRDRINDCPLLDEVLLGVIHDGHCLQTRGFDVRKLVVLSIKLIVLAQQLLPDVCVGLKVSSVASRGRG